MSIAEAIERADREVAEATRRRQTLGIVSQFERDITDLGLNPTVLVTEKGVGVTVKWPEGLGIVATAERSPEKGYTTQEILDNQEQTRAAENAKAGDAPGEPNQAGAQIVKGPFTNDEKSMMLTMHKAGRSPDDMARVLNRDIRGVKTTLRNVVNAEKDRTGKFPTRGPAPGVKPAAATEGAAGTTVAAAHGAPFKVIDYPADLPVADRPEYARLYAVAVSGDWRRGDDVDLVKCFGEGMKLAQVALEFGIDPAVIKKRFDLLCPVKTPDAQAKVYRLLQMIDRAGR